MKVLAFAVSLLTLTTFNKPAYGFVERGSYADDGSDTYCILFLAERKTEKAEEAEEGKESKPEGSVVITSRV